MFLYKRKSLRYNTFQTQVKGLKKMIKTVTKSNFHINEYIIACRRYAEHTLKSSLYKHFGDVNFLCPHGVFTFFDQRGYL